MQRVEAAIRQNRCVVALGGRLLQDNDVMMEVRRRALPSVALGGDPSGSIVTITEDALIPAVSTQGGMVVLVEPEAASDGRGLEVLAKAIKGGAHKPKIVVAARAFNPFALPMGLRLLKLEHLKLRARDFMGQLPLDVGAPAEAKAETPKKKKKQESPHKVPRPSFVGREEELASLGEMLQAEGGPIVVHGPAGVGKRWLVERAINDTELERLPDFTFGRGVGGDTLLARIACIAELAENEEFTKQLRAKDRPEPASFAETAAQVLSAPVLANKVWVIHGLHTLLDRRNGSLYREDRLGLTVWQLLLNTPALKLIFVTEERPQFFKEGQGQHLRTLPLEGIKGKELHQLFEVWHSPEVPRDRFGHVHQRTHGHPMSSRAMAIQSREDSTIDDLLEAPKFLKAESINDLEALKRHFKRRVNALSDDQRGALAAAAHLPEPALALALNALGVNRNARLALLAAGLLEQTPHIEDRKYYVHPMVREHLGYQEASDFGLMETLARWMGDQVRGGRGIEFIATLQEANRLLVEARRNRSRNKLPFPDADPDVESIRNLMRRKKARLDIARARVNECLKADGRNTELLLADAELKIAERKGLDEIRKAFERAEHTAPTPEVFHQVASFLLDKNKNKPAIETLERGIAKFPANARLHRRLAFLYLRVGDEESAEKTLRQAMELEPMMPDAYGALGEMFLMRGPSGWDEASNALEEALRLDPENADHLTRRARLYRLQGIGDEAQRDALWKKAGEDLRQAIQLGGRIQHAQVLLGTLLLDTGEDLDQAEWHLKKAMKQSETADALIQRARVLIRRAAFQDAEKMLQRATKKAPKAHPAHAAKGELWSAQGQVFLAFDAYKHAKEVCPDDAPEQKLYDAQMAQLSALIESGAAGEMAKAGQADTETEPALPETDGAVRRDPGTTTIRRKKGDEPAVQASPEPSASPEPQAQETAPVVQAQEPAAEVQAQESAPEAQAQESAAPEVQAQPTVDEAPSPKEAAPEAPSGDTLVEAPQS